MSSRFLSNAIVLALFAVGSIGLTLLINWIAQAEVQTDHEFSFERRTADQHLLDGNWSAAARYYKNVADADPENGGAKLSYAWSIAQQQQPFLDQIRTELQSEDPDVSVMEQASQSAMEFGEEAISAYQDVLEFPRFRNRVRFLLSQQYALAGDRNQALKYLREAVQNGFRPRFPIRKYQHYWRLLNDPEFRRFMQ